jgi:hypothetical protein
MTHRGKRLTCGVMVVGLVVVLGLAFAYRNPILQHVEAWRFQLTRETKTALPDAALKELRLDGDGQLLRSQICREQDTAPLIFLRLFATTSGYAVIWAADDSRILDWQIILPTRPEEVGTDVMKAELEAMGWRVLEQRLPRRAYVLMIDPAPKATLPTRDPGSFDSFRLR